VVLSDRRLVRDLITTYLHTHGFPQAAGGEGSLALFSAIPRERPSLVFVDVGSDQQDSREILREARRFRPRATVVAVGTPTQLAAHALEGVHGWIELSEPGTSMLAVAEALTHTRQGPLRRPPSPRVQRELATWRKLSRRQRQVLGLLGCGTANGRLAEALGITERAVKAHVSALLDKFKADNRTELALIASRAALHSPLAGPLGQ
jgi:DNA-binding NarL/FixJ family response regulator